MRFVQILLLALPMCAQTLPPNSSGVSMGHIHILTPDPEAHRKLWIDVLGGKPAHLGPVELAKFPGVFVGFRKADSGGGGTEGSVIDHLGFLTKDLAGTKAKLVANGVTIVKEMPDTHQFFAMFPDAIKVEFTEDKTISEPIRHHHVHFASHQVQEMRAWYARMFDAIPGVRGKFQAADLPGVNLSWNPATEPRAASKGRAVDHIGFEVKGIQAFCKKLEAAGVKMEMQPTERKDLGATIAFLNDPWGTRIELTEGLGKL